MQSFWKAKWKDGKEPLFYFFSLSLLLTSYLKFKFPEQRHSIIKVSNKLFFWITITFTTTLLITTYHIPLITLQENFLFSIFTLSISIYAFFRANEIFYTFVKDSYSHLSPTSLMHGKKLKHYERLPLAMLSYLELIFLYGILFFVVSLNGFCLDSLYTQCHTNLSAWEAIYFSGVTITTLGYGDFIPNCWFTQFLSIYEVLNGFSLIIISFAVYVARSINAKEYENT